MATALSWLWILVSLGCVAKGMRAFGTATDTRSMVCGPETCTLTVEATWGGPAQTGSRVERFPRASLVRAQAVRVRHRKVRDFPPETSGAAAAAGGGMGGKKRGKVKASRKVEKLLGHSYTVSFVNSNGVQEDVPMALDSLGARAPQAQVDRVNSFVSDPAASELNLVEAHGFDVSGILWILVGGISVCFAVSSFFGDSDEYDRRSRRDTRPLRSNREMLARAEARAKAARALRRPPVRIPMRD